MSFKVKIYRAQFNTWQSWKDWVNNSFLSYSEYCVKHYPGCISINTIIGGREFTFESEAHFTWFLLQQ
jgi:hypothetical protein